MHFFLHLSGRSGNMSGSLCEIKTGTKHSLLRPYLKIHLNSKKAGFIEGFVQKRFRHPLPTPPRTPPTSKIRGFIVCQLLPRQPKTWRRGTREQCRDSAGSVQEETLYMHLVSHWLTVTYIRLVQECRQVVTSPYYTSDRHRSTGMWAVLPNTRPGSSPSHSTWLVGSSSHNKAGEQTPRLAVFTPRLSVGGCDVSVCKP